jgi:hypothetical protein
MASIGHDLGSDRDALFLYKDANAIFYWPSNVLHDVSAGDNIHNVADTGICRPLSAPDMDKYKR